MMRITFPGVHGNDYIYMKCLRAVCGDTEGKSMIDICSNLSPHTPLLGFKERVYVDILSRQLDHPQEQQYFVQDNVLDYLNQSTQYDVGICSDGIEHFTEDDGILLLKLMQVRTDRMVLFTPLGDHMVDKESKDPEGHHSGWTPEMLDRLFPGFFAFISFPEYHPTLGVGAFFFWHCKNIEQDFNRVVNELKQD